MADAALKIKCHRACCMLGKAQIPTEYPHGRGWGVISEMLIILANTEKTDLTTPTSCDIHRASQQGQGKISEIRGSDSRNDVYW